MIKINTIELVKSNQHITLVDRFLDKLDNKLFDVVFDEHTYIKLSDYFDARTLTEEDKDIICVYLAGLKSVYNYKFNWGDIYTAILRETKDVIILK